ncbi:MAG: Nramp family divalent metal transporter [Desulforhopalus sp.]|nr:Nramp family divalent metal transporter [Desulforhopalus sp.]
MKFNFETIDRKGYRPVFAALEIFKYIGPGLLITVGFIDPGNWAANIAAGAGFGYRLLWMVTLSTIMLIVLQHNVAHLGIATGLCLSEAATTYTPKALSRGVLLTAVLASISTSLAEIMGGAIALNMLFHIPIVPGSLLMIAIVGIMLFSNSYKITEKIIVGFVSIIGLSFLYELILVDIDWSAAAAGWITPTIPEGSIMIVMSVLGAVVMPHNLFLHSEVIQSRQWNLEDENTISKQLDYEFLDTLMSMGIGWAINSAMILLAAATFFKAGRPVNELQQAQSLLTPLVGENAAVIFAVALLFAGLASTITSAMAGGTIFAGMYNEPYDLKDNHTRLGVAISLLGAFAVILFIGNPFRALILSQMLLSIQLPFTIFLQIYLTSSRKVMGKYANSNATTLLLLFIGTVITLLNVLLFKSFL